MIADYFCTKKAAKLSVSLLKLKNMKLQIILRILYIYDEIIASGKDLLLTGLNKRSIMISGVIFMDPIYIAIDLKSFYASVECVERGLDPLTTNLVVADESRTDKTICLAVSPALKTFGIPGRPRLFEVKAAVKRINAERKCAAKGKGLTGSSYYLPELSADPALLLDFIIAVPQMATYMRYSTEIYKVYLKYIAPEDIHVYSCDEVFMDVSQYLTTYHMTARELAEKMIYDVFDTFGITATAGIGTNLFLCKVAMDIVAKHMPPDAKGVRIAELDEMLYRKTLWEHTPITDFWRVGNGIARKLFLNGLETMGDVARCSENNEELLYRLFGVNAELLIDHAWGWEPCTIADIKAYKPESNSVSSGQVLQRPYTCKEARLVVREMTEALAYDLMEKQICTKHMELTIGYDAENAKNEKIRAQYKGKYHFDGYGRRIPDHSHGTVHLEDWSSNAAMLSETVLSLYDRIVNPILLIRRINVCACGIIKLADVPSTEETYEQLDLFTDYAAREKSKREEKAKQEKELAIQSAAISIKKKFGKNALLKGSDLLDGATTIERNKQIGGHRA